MGLYLPLGFALGLVLRRPRLPYLIVIGLTVTLELAQLAIPGRFGVPSDVLYDGLGGSLGIAAARSRVRWLAPSPRLGRRLAIAATGVGVAVLIATGWLVQPSFPQVHYWGQWTADLAHLGRYEGEVLEASIGEVAAPNHRLPDSEMARSLLLAGAPVQFTFRSGPRPDRLVPIFSVLELYAREIALYGIDSRDLVFRYRSRAKDLRLDQPDLAIVDGAALLTPGDTITIRVERREAGFCIGLDGSEWCGLEHTAGRGWALLFYPEQLGRRVGGLLDFLWLFVLALPVGFWAADSRLFVPLAGTLVALAAVLPLFVPLVGFSIWVGVGAVGGAALGRALGGRHPSVGGYPSEPRAA